MSISNKIKYYRKLAMLTQAELAQKLGITHGAVNAWENGRTKPTYENLEKLAKILRVSVFDLADGESIEQEQQSTLGGKIKQARMNYNLTQQELAKMLGVSTVAVTKWETGVTEPASKNLQKISQVLNVDLNSLISNAEKPAYLPKGAHKLIADDDAYIPIRRLGVTHAGEMIEAIEDSETEYLIPRKILERHKDAFALDVVGDCMDRIYPNGCVVVVDPSYEPRNDDGVVVEYQGETILRQYVKGGSTLILAPNSTNDAYEDLVFKGEFDEVNLVGVVVWWCAKSDIVRVK